jgi:hypothetical protein
MVLLQRLTDVIVVFQLPIGSLLRHWQEFKELNIKYSSYNVFLLFLILTVDIIIHPCHVHDQLKTHK